MLKSFCIKTNNNKITNYLLENYKKITLENTYISSLKFKVYNNVILHYKGNNLDLFYNTFSEIISSCIIQFYEKSIINRIISSNYFYFSHIEQQKIFHIVNNYLDNNELNECIIRKNSIKASCYDYFANNKTAILDGFINFRLNDYIKIMDCIVDLAVNKFVIDREYSEFINLLKSYINSKCPNKSYIHLIYNNQESILLDEFKNEISINNNAFDNSKLVSDISFSTNDYTLNTLLTLLPEKIYIHLIDNVEDEFINTLKLIFSDRIHLCNDCNICELFKLNKIKKW